MCDLKAEFNKSWLPLKSPVLWAVPVFSHPSVFLFSLLSEWIILSSYSLTQINGDLRMGPHKPPRSSTSLCHCHGDSSERPGYMAGLVGDTKCFLVVPRAHMDTYADSSSIKGDERNRFLFSLTVQLFASSLFTLCPIHVFTVQRLFSWLSGRSHATDSFRFPRCLVDNRF